MIENIIAAILGGLFVLVVSRVLAYRDLKKVEANNNTLKNPNEDKILTSDLLYSLMPGRSYEKVREILGAPDKSFKDESIFVDFDESIRDRFNSDLYLFKNGHMKITTEKENEKNIYALTVLNCYGIDIPDLYYIADEGLDYSKIGEIRVSDEILRFINQSESIRTRIDNSFAIQQYLGNPHYKYFTVFCGYLDEDNDISKYKGELIDGFCISEGEDAFFIYHYDLSWKTKYSEIALDW